MPRVTKKTAAVSHAFDLTGLKPDQISKFRNLAIANVIRPIIDGSEDVASHDRHYSNHSKDKANSFLIRTNDPIQPAQLFKGIKAKAIDPKLYVKQLGK